MTILTKRPTSTTQNGVWSLTGGATIDAILADADNATYISSTVKAESESQFAIIDIDDFTDVEIPDTARIYAVRQRVTVLQQAAPSGSSFLENIIRFYGQFVQEVVQDAVTGQIGNLLAGIFRFLFPVKPSSSGSATWQTVDLAYSTTQPDGGPWTRSVLNALKWRLGRSDSSGVLAKISAFYVDVEFFEAATVTIIAPNPTTVDGTTRPVIGWTVDDPDGAATAKWWVRIFEEAVYSDLAFDPETSPAYAESGEVNGTATQWLTNKDLPNGNYRVAVKTAKQWKGAGDLTSEWATYDIVMNVEVPPAPLVTATANNVAGWTQIDLAAGGPDPATETFSVYYSDNAGLSYKLLWGGWQIQADELGAATVFDYFAPNGRARHYIAKAYRTLTESGIKVASPPSEDVYAVPARRGFWLVDPFAPSRNMRITVTKDDPTRLRAGTVHRPLLADGLTGYVFKVNGPVWGIEGDMEITFRGPDETSGWNNFNAIYRDGYTVLLLYPSGEYHWIQWGDELKNPWKPRGREVQYRQGVLSYYEQPMPDDPNTPEGAV